MADISKINPNGTEYNLKDATARSAIENTNENIQSSITVPKASVVTVTDAAPINAEDITVDITPKQDLHGYDRPWAGGGGKNKLPMTVEGIKAVNTAGTWSGNVYTINNGTIEILVDGANNVIGIKFNGTFNDPVFFVVGQPNVSGTFKLVGCPSGGEFEITYGLYQFRPNTGAIAYDSGNGQIIYVAVIDFIQIVIRRGYTATNLIFKPMVCDDTSATYNDFAPYSNICPIEGRTGAELDRVEGYFDGRYPNIDTSVKYRAIQVGNGTFTMSSDANGNNSFALLFFLAGNVSSGASSANNGVYNGHPVTVTTNDGYVTVGYRTGAVETQTPVGTHTKIEKGAVATPYQGQQYTASFGETVHGGKWHVTEGGTDKTHANIANYNGETINEPWLSSMDEYVAGATPTTGAQVVYPLTTPTTISTRKQNVPMLKGINTVYADCGDTSLKYQPDNVIGELKGEIQVANSFVAKMALREGSGAKDFSYGGWSFRLYIYRSMGQISMSVERISASSVTEQAVVKVFNDESDYRAPEELRPNFNLLQAATYTTPSGWAIQVYLKDDGYIMFTGIAPEVGASAPTSSNWNLVEPWATHQQAKDLFNN